MTLVIDRNIDRLSQGRFVDLTDILVEIPRNISIIDALGIFEENYLQTSKLEIQRSQYANHLIKDKNWDAKPDTLVGRPVRGFIQAKVPNFQLLDAIKPSDIDGIQKVESLSDAVQLQEVADVRTEKLFAINNAFDLTADVAKMQLLTRGTVYAPAGTLATSYGDTIDFYQEMGVTRQTVNLELSGASDPRTSVSGLIRQMRVALRNSASNGNYRSLVILCGSDFFDDVLTNPFVTDAIKYFQQDLNRLLVGVPETAPGFDANFRSITVWGVTFIDAGTGGYDGPDGVFVPWIAADQAIALPTGVRGMFKTHYAPPKTFSTINSRYVGRYYFEKLSEEDDLINMKAEQNFINVLTYPAAVFTITKS